MKSNGEYMIANINRNMLVVLHTINKTSINTNIKYFVYLKTNLYKCKIYMFSCFEKQIDQFDPIEMLVALANK